MNALQYPVLTTFRDKYTKVIHQKGSQYETGDAKRAAELQKLGFIGKASETVEEWPKSVGGGYWELPNGERVRGKENALAALEALNAPDDEGGDVDGQEIDGQQAE